MKTFVVEHLVEARSEAEFEASWAQFQHLYRNATTETAFTWFQELVLECERWALPWRRKTLTLGYKASSPAESTNGRLKVWMHPTFTIQVSVSERAAVSKVNS
jgi:hypothetical protein